MPIPCSRPGAAVDLDFDMGHAILIRPGERPGLRHAALPDDSWRKGQLRQPPSPSVMLPPAPTSPVEPPRLLTVRQACGRDSDPAISAAFVMTASEMIRAVSFIVRDKNWGTYDPAISDLAVSETLAAASRSPMMR